jgi:hypothetical protein
VVGKRDKLGVGEGIAKFGYIFSDVGDVIAIDFPRVVFGLSFEVLLEEVDLFF